MLVILASRKAKFFYCLSLYFQRRFSPYCFEAGFILNPAHKARSPGKLLAGTPQDQRHNCSGLIFNIRFFGELPGFGCTCDEEEFGLNFPIGNSGDFGYLLLVRVTGGKFICLWRAYYLSRTTKLYCRPGN
jgi:hypothetical protein